MSDQASEMDIVDHLLNDLPPRDSTGCDYGGSFEASIKIVTYHFETPSKRTAEP